LLLDSRHERFSFCTADKAALRAAVMLGLGERCVSLEALLKAIGLQKSLSVQYSESWMMQQLEAAKEDRIYGWGPSS